MSERTLQKAIGAAAAMYETRRAMRILLGESYPERVKVYAGLVRNRMEETGLDAVMALQTMLHAGELSLSAVSVALLVSAAIEIGEEEPRPGAWNIAALNIPALYLMEVAPDARAN